MSKLECIERQNSPYTAIGSVIWLHGLGANGNDFAPIVDLLTLPSNLSLRFIMPNAPSIPVTLNQGMVMPAWFDLSADSNGFHSNEEDIKASSTEVVKLIDREIARGIAPNKIVLAGFSQGGVVVGHTVVNYPEPLAGLMCLSTYLLEAEQHKGSLSMKHPLPVFIGHGTKDPMVPINAAEATNLLLSNAKCDVTFQKYPVEHTVCEKEIDDISEWLCKVYLKQ